MQFVLLLYLNEITEEDVTDDDKNTLTFLALIHKTDAEL
jgi:hypothetical protein